jgi:imidazolonepropionase-like amidohydrolase
MWEEMMRKSLGALCSLLVLGLGCEKSTDLLAITETTVVDGRTGVATANVSILIEGDRIVSVSPANTAAIPARAQVVDGRGKWVVPGFIDVHVHAGSDRVLARALALGVTTVHLMPTNDELSLGWDQAARPAEDPIPRVQLTPVLFTGTFPDNNYPDVFPIATPHNREEARARVEELASQGVRQIKIIQEDGLLWNGPDRVVPRLDPEVFDELVAEAHRRGLRVYVHATQVEDIRQSVRARAQAFMHGAMDAPLDPSLISAMRESSIVWTPALRIILEKGNPRGHAERVLADGRFVASLFESEAAGLTADAAPDRTWPESPDQELMAHVAERLAQLGSNTRSVLDGGVPVAVGSDLGWVGIGTHVEMELLGEAGLSPAEVFVAATYGGALALGMEDELGTLEPGKRADLAVLGADPLADVRNAREVAWVVKAGTLFDPAELLADTAE